uniref:Uncharacterized protein n=1 Tax=Anguilla anguilla TaxID=7936 RepID=A0A0E9V3Z0_ANGAN
MQKQCRAKYLMRKIGLKSLQLWMAFNCLYRNSDKFSSL